MPRTPSDEPLPRSEPSPFDNSFSQRVLACLFDVEKSLQEGRIARDFTVDWILFVLDQAKELSSPEEVDAMLVAVQEALAPRIRVAPQRLD